ncbi:UbiA family prenyltransferase [Trichloromonas sp.]|uniref:UbiA family prenyltransferase n=1 Tax=Trichloromonas sp. TaxID=3069249 RepID=UPI003D81B87C
MKCADRDIGIRAPEARPEPTILTALLRLPMSAMVAVSALAGYLAFPGHPVSLQAALLTTAILLLAAGCSALNQVQERAEDALMERTRRRPLPAGRLEPGSALAIAGALIAAALLLLGRLEHPIAGWGVGALLLYNGLYTGLKKRTPFALLFGALCGALPPLMGWCAAGGDPTDHRIIGLAALFLLWQVPHTWALSARHPGDSAGGPFASLFKSLSAARLNRLNQAWLLGLAIATLQLPAFGTLRAPAAQILCLGLSFGLLLCAARSTGKHSAQQRSKGLILYMTTLVCLVIFDNLTV